MARSDIATDSASILRGLTGDDATATFESDPKFVDSNPTATASSENVEVQRDTDDTEDSEEEDEDAADLEDEGADEDDVDEEDEDDDADDVAQGVDEDSLDEDDLDTDEVATPLVGAWAAAGAAEIRA